MTTLFKKRYLVMPLLMLSMSACQPRVDKQPNAPIEAKTTPLETNQSEHASVSVLNAAEEEKSTHSIEDVAATAINPDTNKVSCDTVRDMMTQVGEGSKIDAIVRINKALPACLEQTDSATALSLLTTYDEMYNRFLNPGFDNQEDIDAFYNLVYQIQENKKTTSAAEYAALDPHPRYLLDLSQGDDGIYLKYLGKDYYTFSHDLEKMVALFAPYLAEEDRAFVQRMAKDNQGIFWNDAAINVSFDNLIERALYWEGYLQRYPNGRHSKGAKALYKIYHATLFFGSPNKSWTDDTFHTFIEPEYNLAMIDLANKPNSQLAKDTKKFLAFMQTSDAERRGDIEIDDEEYLHVYITIEPLEELLDTPNPWQGDTSLDCFSGIFCYQY